MKVNEIYTRMKENPLLVPLPILIGLTLFFIIFYIIMIFFKPFFDIYGLFELKSTKILSPFTSFIIHNTSDNGEHLISNMMGLCIFGYFVSIQTSWRRMVLIFFLSGILTNLIVIHFVNLMNDLLAPIFISWATSLGLNPPVSFKIMPLSGGGTSDGIMGLVGSSIILSISFFLRLSNIKTIFRGDPNLFTNFFGQNLTMTILTVLVFILGIITFRERLLADFEKFSYLLTNNYALISGESIPYPVSRGNGTLAHVFGWILGIILGIWCAICQRNEEIPQI